MTTRVSKRIEFDAGHRVPDHASKCRSPHGHRYTVEVTVSGDVIDEPGRADNGMVVDFGELKRILVEHVHDPLDHAMIVFDGDHKLRGALVLGPEVEAFDGTDIRINRTTPYEQSEVWKVVVIPYVPTAENLARWIAETIAGPVFEWNARLDVDTVTVWETPTCSATWARDDPWADASTRRMIAAEPWPPDPA